MCKQILDIKLFRCGLCISCSNACKRKEYAKHKDRYADRYKNKVIQQRYSVYKFLDKDNNIIYIGKSKRLEARMITHFNNGHLTDECYNSVQSVFYCSFTSITDMDIYEIYLIDKYKPIYNTVFRYEVNEQSSIKLPDLQWMKYLPA